MLAKLDLSSEEDSDPKYFLVIKTELLTTQMIDTDVFVMVFYLPSSIIFHRYSTAN